MKKPENRPANSLQNSELSVTTSLFEPSLLQNLVEKLADLHVDNGFSLEEVQDGWEAIDTSTIEAYINGDNSLSVQSEMMNIPFVTCFLFTCIKTKGEEYKLCWSHSLS
ncbi:MAG TPA: hypothetical protein VET23_10890 [Chitinophagaceae bacterium]|nr:hypothetical protein [Chitinophagaceae bacterium]